MKDNRDRNILKLLIGAIVAITIALICLILLFGLAFEKINKSLHDINKSSDIVGAVNQLNTTELSISKAISNIKIVNGKDGQNAISTNTIVQQAVPIPGVNGSNGASAYDIWLQEGHSGTRQDFLNSLKGASGTAGCRFEVDGLGNYRCSPGDDWLPLGL